MVRCSLWVHFSKMRSPQELAKQLSNTVKITKCWDLIVGIIVWPISTCKFVQKTPQIHLDMCSTSLEGPKGRNIWSRCCLIMSITSIGNSLKFTICTWRTRRSIPGIMTRLLGICWRGKGSRRGTWRWCLCGLGTICTSLCMKCNASLPCIQYIMRIVPCNVTANMLLP